jgi:hypothetical protein
MFVFSLWNLNAKNLVKTRAVESFPPKKVPIEIHKRSGSVSVAFNIKMWVFSATVIIRQRDIRDFFFALVPVGICISPQEPPHPSSSPTSQEPEL